MASEIETLEEKKHEDAAMDIEEKENEESKQEEVEGSDGEEEDEGEESKGKRRKKNSGKKEPVTPVDRPTRERKTVERYTESMQRLMTPKPFSIEKGSGTQLKDIPNVAYKLSKRKADDTLQSLHTVLFSKRAKMNTVKKNIGLFSGFVWADDELEKQKLKVKEKLDKFTKEKLFEFCDIMNLQVHKSSLKKAKLSLKLLEFLQSPHATTEVLLAEKEQKAKNKKARARKSRTPSTKQSCEKRKRATKAKEEKNVEEDEGSESEDESKEEDEKNTPSKPESDEEMAKSEEGGDDEDGNNSESDNEKEKSEEGGDDEDKSAGDEEKDESEKQEKSSSKKTVKKDSKAVKKDGVESPAKSNKKSKKAATPASSAKSKVSSSKKVKEEKSSKKAEAKSSAKKSAKDQGKGKTNKKAKPEPTNEEMHAVVVSILKEVDFNTATLSDIIKQLGGLTVNYHHFLNLKIVIIYHLKLLIISILIIVLGTHFGQDLLHRKAEVKAIITDVINNMSGDEDEEEDKEAGGGSDEDGDGDNSDS
ncbi:DEK domain-containing chromatin-associated protein 1-like isoform X1 [Bidens hawaiensis]|uniref:DEK domain-containing chromatin-associated protein 1-like isoform X1 n=1 Tax=Bidens hawaiensis TaxID=980011 RepID=UPI00404B81C7